MSEKRKIHQTLPPKRAGKAGLPAWLVIAGAALVLIALGAVLFGSLLPDQSTVKVTGSPPEANGARLSVDRPSIDFGDVKLGQSVTAEFTLTNTGSGPLRFSEAPYIELKEGC